MADTETTFAQLQARIKKVLSNIEALPPAKYEGEWVQFPEYTPECYTDPAWGINKDMAYDCGKPHGKIWKYAWAGMKDQWPMAYKVAKNYTIDTAELFFTDVQVPVENLLGTEGQGFVHLVRNLIQASTYDQPCRPAQFAED
mgnify:CR=1 FL=1